MKKPKKTTYTVYRLRDPRTMKIRYIGMTQQTLIKRVNQHMSEKYHSNKPKYFWMRELIWSGFNPLIEPISEHNTKEEALNAELINIYFYLLKGSNLLNKEAKQFNSNPSKYQNYLGKAN